MRGSWVLVAAILGSSMSFIDTTAVNVALPVIGRDLRADVGAVQWVIEGYALFLSALLLLGGSLGDVYGRRRMFGVGIALFALASAACALAPNVTLLIAARCLQGIGGACAVPESLALISANFEGVERGRAVGTWSGFASLTAAAGPVLGGWLAQAASWRWVFVLNLPLAVAVLAIVAWRVPESRDEQAGRTLDVSGAALATAGLGSLVYGLIRLEGGGAASIGLAAVAAGLGLLVALVLVERRERHPMLPLALFRSRAFSAVNAYTFALYLALGASMYFLPFTLIDVQGYAPAAAGATLLPFVLVQVALARWSGGLVASLGPRTPLVVGATLAGFAFLGYAWPGIGQSYWSGYFPATLVLGLGGAFFIAPLTTIMLDAAGDAHSGIASAVNNALARTAGLVAIALFGLVLVAVFDRGFGAAIARQHVSARAERIAFAQRGRLAAGAVPADIPPPDRPGVAAALGAAYLAGFRVVMLSSAAVAFGAAAFAVLAFRPQRPLALSASPVRVDAPHLP